jgi:ABC-type glutathione transport system ATPase component
MNETKHQNHPLLEVENLSIGFEQYIERFKQGVIQPIKSLNLTVNKGEIVAIVGASGSGKSLLAHSIIGILPNNAIEGGSIRYNGELLTQKRKEELRKTDIALIPQSVNYLDPLMQVGKQVQSIIYQGNSETKQKAAFARYKLGQRADKLYPFQLSGGMARRVLITTAVVRGPKLIIADEPTPGLSADLVKETLKNLRELAENGCGILMITHDIEAALQIADRIAVFFDGATVDTVNKSEFSGTGERLSNPYTRKLWQALPQNQFISAKDILPETNHIPETIEVLQAKDISFGYNGDDKILKDFDITLHTGEIVGLKGPSGRGKTTLGKILAGYVRPQKGAVTVNGKLYRPGTYNPVQLIYQHPEKAINPRWKLKKTLTEACPPDQEVLEALGINDAWLARYPHELSGGELQRFCIARVLHKDTRFLIADEMTTMLDAIIQARVWELILHYRKKYNMGLLVISHEDSIIEKLCSRAIDLAVV